MSSQNVQLLFVGAVVALLALFHWIRRFFWVFSVLVLPGTFAHECCHLLLGLALNGRPAGFNLLPRRAERGWEMGSATFSNLRWYNVFFVGMAPLLLLPAAYGLMRWRLGGHPALDWQEVLAVYLVANLVYAALPSWQDFRLAARSPIGWLLLAAGAAYAWHRYEAVSAPVSAPPAAAPAPHASSA